MARLLSASSRSSSFILDRHLTTFICDQHPPLTSHFCSRRILDSMWLATWPRTKQLAALKCLAVDDQLSFDASKLCKFETKTTHWINDWQGFVVDQTSFKYGSYIHWQKNKFGRFYCLWIKIWGVWKLFPLQSNLIRSSVWSMHDDDWWLIIVIKEMIFIIMDVWCYKSMRMTKNGAIWFLSALLSSVFLCQLFLSLSLYVFVFVFVFVFVSNGAIVL